jgi:hypothetical protein
VRVAEVDRDIGGDAEFVVQVHLDALIPGQRSLQMSW